MTTVSSLRTTVTESGARPVLCRSNSMAACATCCGIVSVNLSMFSSLIWRNKEGAPRLWRREKNGVDERLMMWRPSTPKQMSRHLVGGADQHLDLALARLLRVAEGTVLNPVVGHSRLNKRLANRIHATLAQFLVLRVVTTRTGRAIQSKLERWILFHIGGNFLRHIGSGRRKTRLVRVEPEIAI